MMDRISFLPQDTIDKIPTLMPVRDAVRTSILSRKWRYCWTSMPRLAFSVVDVSSNNKEFNKHKLLKDIFHVLLLHTGPILDFSICINDTEIANEIDPIILHLSRSNNIKKFHFVKMPYDDYRLPFSFFTLQGLEHLDLTGCIIDPPIMFNGFSMLRSLCFHNCIITSEMLRRFLTNCPLLVEFSLDVTEVSEVTDYIIGVTACEFVELFKCLSSVHLQVLKWSRFNITDFDDFDAYDIQLSLPTPLVHLRILVLDVCFRYHDETTCVLYVINSSPNLEKIKLRMWWEYPSKNFENMFDREVLSNLKLDHLKELEITNFNNVAHEMEFVKLIMAKSPVLKLARLKLSPSVTADEEFKMFQDLLRLPFPRASPAANFIIERHAD